MKHFITIVLSFVSLSTAFSCSCWGPAFCELVHTEQSGINQGYQLQAIKIQDVSHGMQIKVIENYGQPLDNEIVTVWGDVGLLCREYTSIFSVGDTMILNLIKVGDFPFSEVEDPEDFVLSFCGVHYLRVTNGRAVGGIYDFEQSDIPLDEVVNLMENSTCQSSISGPITSVAAEVWPNPFLEECKIVADKEMSSVAIFDAQGQKVTEEIDFNSTINDIENFRGAPGVYFVRIIFQDREEKVIKIIKG